MYRLYRSRTAIRPPALRGRRGASGHDDAPAGLCAARRQGLRSSPMGWEPRQKDLVLILARDVAARLATPMFVIDAEGTLVFFNEAAEAVLGQTFADSGEMPLDEWSTAFSPVDHDGTPIPAEE